MKRILILLSIFSITIACKQKAADIEDKPIVKEEQITSDIKQNSKIGRNNYAIVWKWKTSDIKLVEDNLVKVADEVNSIWKEDIIADAYYNSDSKIDKLAYFPNISFILKARSYEQAEEELNKLSLVTEGIASYTIYPVGTKWLGRDANKINSKGITFSYAAVWSTKNPEKASDDLTKSQSDAILKLWNEGTIENVYFDIQWLQEKNNTTDFIFYINANTAEKAKSICEQLPFAKNDIAEFKLYSVGVFWLGDNKN